MNDFFEKKVRATAVAAWWVVLIGYVALTVIWLVYLAIVTNRPESLRALWGQDVTLGLHANAIALVHVHIQNISLVSVSGGSMVDAVGEAVAENGSRRDEVMIP